jgi:integrase
MAYTKIIWRNNKYVLQVKETKDGKYKQIFHSLKKKEVELHRAKIQAKTINIKAELSRRTFVDTYKEFYKYKIELASNKYSKIRLSSVTCYKAWYNRWIKPYFNSSVLLTEITPAKHARPFFLKLRDFGVSWVEARRIVASFLTCLKYAAEQQYVEEKEVYPFSLWSPKKDPATMSANPEEMEFRKTPMISLGEVERLIKYLNPIGQHKKILQGKAGLIHESTDIKDWQKFAVILMFPFAGMRISEVRGLKWDCVDLEKKQIKVRRTVVGNGGSQDKVKAIGSKRDIIIHPGLLLVLTEWKKLLYKYYGEQRPTFVFPSLRNTGSNIPICDRTITDWIKLAFADIGIAKVKVHAQNARPDKKAFVELLECRYKKVITRTFRHFYSTALLNAQAKNPEQLTNNFIKRQVGHQDDETTRLIYGDHDNFDVNIEKQQQAIAQAIPIGIGGGE